MKQNPRIRRGQPEAERERERERERKRERERESERGRERDRERVCVLANQFEIPANQFGSISVSSFCSSGRRRGVPAATSSRCATHRLVNDCPTLGTPSRITNYRMNPRNDHVIFMTCCCCSSSSVIQPRSWLIVHRLMLPATGSTLISARLISTG